MSMKELIANTVTHCDTNKLVEALAKRSTTMEQHSFPKDHLMDQIIRQSRQWVERKAEEENDTA